MAPRAVRGRAAVWVMGAGDGRRAVLPPEASPYSSAVIVSKHCYCWAQVKTVIYASESSLTTSSLLRAVLSQLTKLFS